MPDSHVITNLSWDSPQDFYNSLSSKSRNHLRRNVLRNESKFKIDIIPGTDSQFEIDYWYKLYLNVKNKSLELNTFALPRKLFNQLNENENWEIVNLTLKNTQAQANNRPCCVIFSCKTPDAYIPMIIGIDYTFNQQFGIYRQALYQLVIRARQLGKQKILLGFSATIEKKKLGAKPVSTFAYMHISDSYNMEALSAISVLAKNVN